MTRFRTFGVLAATAVIAASAQAQVKIGVITSATGPTSFVGVPQKNSVALLPKKVGDVSIEYIYLDDASDATQSVNNAKKLLGDNIDALIGQLEREQVFGSNWIAVGRADQAADAGQFFTFDLAGEPLAVG